MINEGCKLMIAARGTIQDEMINFVFCKISSLLSECQWQFFRAQKFLVYPGKMGDHYARWIKLEKFGLPYYPEINQCISIVPPPNIFLGEINYHLLNLSGNLDWPIEMNNIPQKFGGQINFMLNYLVSPTLEASE